MSTTPEATMYLDIKNGDTASYPDDQVWISIISDTWGQYLDLNTLKLETYSGNVPGTTSVQLSKLNLPLAIPAIKSARIYIFIGTKDEVTAPIVASGPSPSKPAPGGKTNPPQNLYFDKLEFDTDTPGSYNIDQSNVDMYGFSFTFDITAPGQTKPNPSDRRGITASRSTVISNFQGLADNSSNLGNTQIFKNLLVQNLSGDSIIRIIAPSSAAYADCSSSPYPSDSADWAGKVSHFFDDYIRTKCFVKNRKFSFPDKDNNTRWGQVNSTGDTLSLYYDETLQQPYYIGGNAQNINSLKLPVSKFPDPFVGNNAPGRWQKYDGPSSQVDWGFVIAGAPQYDLKPSTDDAWGWVLATSDPAVMSIAISICRGVMHLDGSDWTNSDYYYHKQSKAPSSSDNPIFYWASFLHSLGSGDDIYALSYDDVFGHSSDVDFASGSTVTITIHSLEDVTP